ncbi:hypothetical protein V1504DRAFT_464049 [Lipomyces starkeyi]
MMGSVLSPIGLFLLGWTGNYPQAIPWIVRTLAGSFVGGGIILIFLSSVTYIVESYLMFAASAMAEYHCSVRIRCRISVILNSGSLCFLCIWKENSWRIAICTPMETASECDQSTQCT